MEDKEKNFRCGLVSIIGRPNVGKSTLLNQMIGEKVSIVSKVPQTTRHRIRGIYTDERGQIIFIDTPGLVKGSDPLDSLLRKASLGTISEAGALIHLVDTSEPTGQEEEDLVIRLAAAVVPIIVGLNKIDLKGKYLPQYIDLWEKIRGQSVHEMKNFVLLPLSGKRGTNIEKLLGLVFDFLPEGPALYPEDTVCDVPQKTAMADIIREKLLSILREEVPHTIAVDVETVQSRPNQVLYIRAVILVERESQKEIVIGKNGQVLKRVGTLARKELEELLESRIFLETYVKARKHWREDLSLLKELGYDPSD